MMVSIYIEGKQYIAENSKNILEVCLSFGFDIPYFCWHPALGSIGACRQCAVKKYSNVGTDKYNSLHGDLVMACMTPVSEGIHICLHDKEVQEFRRGILELLMINHPHDCPVCEEGGNCHLQDMTVMVGQTYRSYRFTKRTHYNQYLGPFIAHEMNRCITCYRCVRYYKDYAGGDDLGVFGIHDNIYFGRVHDGMLQNEFSGNLVEVCPTGVFTDKTQSEFYARKWDILFAPSICQQCSVGCNIVLGERYGQLCRVENRYNGNINGYFLCDRGRFGCGYINRNDRPKYPLKKKNNREWVKIGAIEAISHVVAALKCSDKIIGIGSSRASVESNFALRTLVGPDNFYTGFNYQEQERLLLIFKILRDSGLYVPSIREIENYDAILILGEDITQTSARIALSVRQAIKRQMNISAARSQGIFEWQSEAVLNIARNMQYPLLITGIDKTKLDDVAMLTYYDAVQNQARFGFAIAHALDNTAPMVKNWDPQLNDKLNVVVQELSKSRKSLIISGSSSGSKELIEAAVNVAYALKNRGNEVGITLVVSDVNSMGLIAIGGLKSIDDAFFEINCNTSMSTSVIILENDLYRYVSSKKVDGFLDNVRYLVVLDHQRYLIQEKADLILSVTSFAESNGTVINYEGRAQRFFQLYDPKHYDDNVVILESWRWLYLIRDSYLNYIRENSLNLDYVIDSIVRSFPELIGIKNTAPDASFRVHGQKLAQASYRYSGRTAIHTDLNVHESCHLDSNETMFNFSMEGNYDIKASHKHIAFAWAPGWNSPQAWNKSQDMIGGHLFSGDPGVRLLDEMKRSCNTKILNWFRAIPHSFMGTEQIEKWLITPYWHLFGSDDTSQRSEFIQAGMLEPYVMLNPSDAMRLNIQKNMFLKFTCMSHDLCLPIKLSFNLAIGHIGVPVGFPNIPVFLSGMYAENVRGVVLP